MLVDPRSDIAIRMLKLEQQLDSYQRLHAEELDQIRRALSELKDHVLALALERENAVHGGPPRPG